MTDVVITIATTLLTLLCVTRWRSSLKDLRSAESPFLRPDVSIIEMLRNRVFVWAVISVAAGTATMLSTLNALQTFELLNLPK